MVDSGVIERARSVLDVGCGPGTNAVAFQSAERYVGVDLNPAYIEYATERYSGEFRVVDVRKGLGSDEKFDLVLMNSLMHHLDDEGATSLLRSVGSVLAPDGEIHVLDLVRSEGGLTRMMARADRGDHPRSPEEWESLVEPWMTMRASSIYDLGFGPIAIWRMIYMVLRPSVRSHRSG